MAPKNRVKFSEENGLAERFTNWVGSTSSLVVHTILFITAFALAVLGINLNTILLVLTTAVSLEAIYLAIFIQMTVNRNTKSLEEVEEDIDEIQEDVEGIEKDIDEIQEDVEGIEKDVDEIQEDVDKLEEEDAKDDLHDVTTVATLGTIQKDLQKLMQDLEDLKVQKKE